MKVLLLSPCGGTYGGVEAFVRAIAAEVSGHTDLDLRIVFKRTAGFQLDPHLLPFFARLDVSFCDRASPALVKAIAWADIVHLQGPSPDVIAIAKFLRRPIAVTIHAWRRPGYSLGKLLRRAILKLADARWFDSQFVWDTWEPGRRSRRSKKVWPVSTLPTGTVPIASRRGFAFIGRWIPNKGIEVLIEAYSRAGLDPERWPLTLMGDGPLRERVHALVRERALRGVRMLGFVDDRQKALEIAAARWMVVPPHTREDFGLTAIEARNVGVPCIVTRDGGLPEAAGSDALICEPADVDGLARLLRHAAMMSEEEYAGRSVRTQEQLREQLRPLSFYPDAYRALVRRPRHRSA